MGLIGTRANGETIADIMSTIYTKTTLNHGIVLLVQYQDLGALCRRVYCEVNPLTLKMDKPVSIGYVGQEHWPRHDCWDDGLVSSMDVENQMVIFICVRNEPSFTPIFGGVFNLPQTG